MAGQIAGLVNKEQTCQEIIEEMFTQLQERFKMLHQKISDVAGLENRY